MREVTVNQFRSTLKSCVDEIIADHEPLWVTRKRGEDFVVISAEDWEGLQETLYVLQNTSLMEQIKQSSITHQHNTGYHPSQNELDEINSI